jgi:lysophospholipase L1-like esterase
VQANSYPLLIKRQATGSAAGFQQPTVSAPGLPPLLQLRSLVPLSISTAQGLGQPTNLTLPRPYDNLGVPGARVHDTVATINDGGGLHDLILRNPAFQNTTALQQALSLQPTFVTLWIGNNDVLAAATSGIVIDGVTLTPTAQFEADFRAIVGAVTASGAKMAIANIPSVTSIPFVTTLPPVVVNPTTRQPVLINGSPVPLIGPNGPLAPTDRVLLPASAALAAGFGLPPGIPGSNGQPLGTQFFLDGNELAAIAARVAEYNNVIATVAGEVGAAFIDINTIFGQVASRGVNYGGITYSTAFLTGGLFSYDGVHATPFGYAFVANEFIKAINATYDANIPPVDLFQFSFGPSVSAGTSVEAAKGVIFTHAAAVQLRTWLRVPPTAVLLRLLEERGAGTGGGGGGGTTQGPGPHGTGVTPPAGTPETTTPAPRPDRPSFQ